MAPGKGVSNSIGLAFDVADPETESVTVCEPAQTAQQRIEIVAAKTRTLFDDAVHRGEVIAAKVHGLSSPLLGIQLCGSDDSEELVKGDVGDGTIPVIVHHRLGPK